PKKWSECSYASAATSPNGDSEHHLGPASLLHLRVPLTSRPTGSSSAGRSPTAASARSRRQPSSTSIKFVSASPRRDRGIGSRHLPTRTLTVRLSSHRSRPLVGG